jgi:phosphatidylserine decarboxylase
LHYPSTLDFRIMAPNSDPFSQPKLRRLASKPLKLAASTLRPLSLSRAASPGPAAMATAGLGSGSSSGTRTTLALAPSSSDTLADESVGMGRKKKKGRRLRHLNAGTSGMTPSQIASAARGPRKPLDGEEPAVWVRVRVVKAEGLVAKDRNGTSDP